MNHKYVTLGIAAVIAAVAVSAVGLVIPQQALAHSGHHNYGIKVNQQIDQFNNCTGAPPGDEGQNEQGGLDEEAPSPPTVCLNTADNQADISR